LFSSKLLRANISLFIKMQNAGKPCLQERQRHMKNRCERLKPVFARAEKDTCFWIGLFGTVLTHTVPALSPGAVTCKEKALLLACNSVGALVRHASNAVPALCYTDTPPSFQDSAAVPPASECSCVRVRAALPRLGSLPTQSRLCATRAPAKFSRPCRGASCE
jgi:hypothetical protein